MHAKLLCKSSHKVSSIVV